MKRRTRYDIYKRIDASYYEYKDDEDGVLENLKVVAEEKMRAEEVAEWWRLEKIRREAKRGVKSGEVVTVAKAKKILVEEVEEVMEEARQRESELLKEKSEKEMEFVVHAQLPDDKEIKKMVREKKKKDLLSKYVSEKLLQGQTEAKQMLNIKR